MVAPSVYTDPLITILSTLLLIVAAGVLGWSKIRSRPKGRSVRIRHEMVFTAVLKSLTPPDRDAMRRRLTTIATTSSIGRQIEANIAVEAKLPLSAAREIVTALLAEPNDPDRLRIKYTQICDQHVLSGPVIGGTRPKILGRAVVLQRLCALFVRHAGFRSAKQAEAWLKRQCALKPPDLRTSFRDIALGGQVIWTTFGEPGRDADPFGPLPAAPDVLHDALALDPKDRGLPLVLFVYSPPRGLALRFPTIADARWGRVFRPAVNDTACTCGLTAPPTDDPAIKPMPEAVHEQVFGDVLVMHLRILR